MKKDRADGKCIRCRDTRERLEDFEGYVDRALRLIKAVKKPYCHRVCPVVQVDWRNQRTLSGGTHGTLCQEMQEVEKLLESRR